MMIKCDDMSRYNTDRAEREEYGSALGRNCLEDRLKMSPILSSFSGAGSREKGAGGGGEGEREGSRA